jgi:membrane associated rhomboid family serine protease
MGFADRHYERDNDSDSPRRQWQARGMSPTTWLIVIHVVFFVATVFGAPKIENGMGAYLLFSKNLALIKHEYWRLLSYFLAEDRIINLVFSMFTLYFVGRILEMVWDWRKLFFCYALFALAGGFTAALFVFVFNPIDKSTILYGASAPVLGLIVATTFRFDNLQGSLPFTNAPFSLKTFLAILIGFIVVMTLLGFGTFTSLAASAGGGLAGYLWVTFIKEKGREPVSASKQSWFSRFMARRRQKKREQEAADLAALEVEVDRILVKVREHGLHSLTEAEKRTLKRATDLQNQKPTRL